MRSESMITLKILTENRENEEFKGEPGLSVYVNAFDNKFLLDTGFTDLFLQNAKLMNVDIDEIEKIAITHGHNDHSGGITFLQNKKKKDVRLNILFIFHQSFSAISSTNLSVFSQPRQGSVIDFPKTCSPTLCAPSSR